MARDCIKVENGVHTLQWIGSLERAMDVIEGQIALARALNASAVQVDVEILEQVFKAASKGRKEPS